MCLLTGEVPDSKMFLSLRQLVVVIVEVQECKRKKR